jgi:hypothetical protein
MLVSKRLTLREIPMKHIWLFIPLFLFSCSPITVRTDYDREVDFSAYRTFRWMPYPKNAENTVPRNSPLDKRIRRAVERELESKGYVIQDQGPADAVLAYHVGVRRKVDVSHVHYGYWGWRRATYVNQYKEGTIVLDIVDLNKKELLWRGSAVGVVGSLEESEERIRKSVAKILERYPPK